MTLETELIAPCGMNCGVCLRYLRLKGGCQGCRSEDVSKTTSCMHCVIKNCKNLATTKSGFCYECAEYPCRRLRALDKRYRTKYGMSMMENLQSIKTIGLKEFAANEKVRWRCESCGGSICVHRGYCLTCGLVSA